MCGIAGFSGELADSHLVLADSASSLVHRGPDSNGLYFSSCGQLGLAHTRLAIQDLSPLGHQPMESEDGSVVIVFNGEIYNFKELRSQLSALGCHFTGKSDTEVLLQLYLVNRDISRFASALRQLNGIFAFALWDAEIQSLLIVRDSFGVKPLYFSQSKGVFAFASELKSLFPLVGISPKLDITALDRYLTFLWSPGQRTPAQNILKLGPGEILCVRDGQIENQFRWSQDVLTPFPIPPTRAQAIRDTETHLRQAVYRQMIAMFLLAHSFLVDSTPAASLLCSGDCARLTVFYYRCTSVWRMGLLTIFLMHVMLQNI